MRIVVGTSVVFAALYSSRGASHRLMKWLFGAAEKHCVVSTTLVLEYLDVLLRPENRQYYEMLTQDDIEGFIDDICAISHHQDIHFLWRPFLKDRNDDMVLEVAVNAEASAIITFNPKDFKCVKKYFGIDVMTPKTFLQRQGVLS